MNKLSLHFLVGVLCIVGAAILFFADLKLHHAVSAKNQWVVVAGCLAGAYNFFQAVNEEDK